MQIEIELCGHKGKITNIWGYIAQPPWRPTDIFCVYVEFATSPEGIGGMGIDIPAKEYSRKELLAMVKKAGEKQVAEALERRIKERAKDDIRHRRQATVDALAEKAEEVLKEV